MQQNYSLIMLKTEKDGQLSDHFETTVTKQLLGAVAEEGVVAVWRVPLGSNL